MIGGSGVASISPAALACVCKVLEERIRFISREVAFHANLAGRDTILHCDTQCVLKGMGMGVTPSEVQALSRTPPMAKAVHPCIPPRPSNRGVVQSVGQRLVVSSMNNLLRGAARKGAVNEAGTSATPIALPINLAQMEQLPAFRTPALSHLQAIAPLPSLGVGMTPVFPLVYFDAQAKGREEARRAAQVRAMVSDMCRGGSAASEAIPHYVAADLPLSHMAESLQGSVRDVQGSLDPLELAAHGYSYAEPSAPPPSRLEALNLPYPVRDGARPVPAPAPAVHQPVPYQALRAAASGVVSVQMKRARRQVMNTKKASGSHTRSRHRRR
ncbi:hypothetical protein KIPB_003568 [Kipferlia bialata]|uniref:Uncharacterized protein n=1 Tax=Kipferlia bialata TaxID=797122 RepID=A0A9K3CTM4_9EUKA|nr:hypothetical protein KIPB_003568 [Kipferlia bialata]|eukprot:g3568.t1